MEQQENLSQRGWEGRDMTDPTSERSQLIGEGTENAGAPTPANPSAWKPRLVHLTGITLALVLVGITMFYSFKNGLTLFSFHPTAMAVGWMVLMPVAINSLRIGDVVTSWMPFSRRSTRHWVLQAAAVTLIFLGFIVIVANKITLSKNHFVTYHAIFGLFAIIWISCVVFEGIAALFSLKLKDFLPPIYTKILHGLSGIVGLSLGTITIVLGLFSHVVTDVSVQWFASLLAVVVFVLTALRPCISFYVRLRERMGYVN